MDISDFSFYIVDEQTTIKDFDCGDEDLNSFLQEKAVFYYKELLATTYILEKEDKIVAFFSIFNDSIKVEEGAFVSKSSFKNFLKDILPHPKRHLKNLPALKIGRLGVCNEMKGKGLGKLIMSFIIDTAVDQNNLSACKFISVDAYSQSLHFYEKMGFEYFTQKDINEDTRQMYYDLTPLINARRAFKDVIIEE